MKKALNGLFGIAIGLFILWLIGQAASCLIRGGALIEGIWPTVACVEKKP